MPENTVSDPTHRFHLDREQVLARLWEIANVPPEMTRGSITGQVKALNLIVAIEGLIPDRRAAAQPKPAPAPEPQIYEAAWLVEQRAAAKPPSIPAAAKPKDDPPVLAPAPTSEAEKLAVQPPPDSGPGESTVPEPPTPALPRVPYVSSIEPIPDPGIPFAIRRNRFGHPTLGSKNP